ncbi:MAG: hypothetical protein IJ638_01575 [Alphaproteobacteria bacterium]|nr:hypothetical protein [Alphaproteobacteria bacterium]
MNKKLVALLGLGVLVSASADASNRRHNTIRSSSTNTVNVRGTTTTINASVSDTTKTSSDYTKVAAVTDAVAKRKCTNMVVSALQTYCGKTKCKNATEAYAKITLPNDTSSVNETYCANFIEEAVNNLWDSYDSYALNEKKNCNIALARSLAAEACYRYVLTSQNEKVVISDSDLSGYCGSGAVKAQYAQLTNGDTISDSETGDDLPSYFSKVGNIGWSNLVSYTRLLDLKIDFKTTEFPRDLIQLVNSLKSQGNMMCGEKNYTELYDANIQLVEKKSSLERKVEEEGILKGGKDWVVDQVGVIKGETWAKDKLTPKADK